ncbi:heme biosynthesis HemY N-terminal domain-containing protein, partial [Bordetella tumbae]|uniref:heme biosynthesis HemY N-terminal domain-containing protein n=1 Tax=Bordetella tumbae TaxID=1649139 RepID=UPI0039F07267
MRTWFWTLLLLIVAVALAVVLRSHTGNVIFLVSPWRIELSLTLFVLLVVGIFVALYVGLRLLAWLLAIPDRMRVWRGQRAQARDHVLLERGWTELLEGRFSHAEKNLTKLLGQTRVESRRVLAALSA